jgi:ribosomal protein S27AE
VAVATFFAVDAVVDRSEGGPRCWWSSNWCLAFERGPATDRGHPPGVTQGLSVNREVPTPSILESPPVETDPHGMCDLLVGLPEMTMLGITEVVGGLLRVHVQTRALRPGCPNCGTLARVKERPVVELVDLPAFGRLTRLVWHKRRWRCGTSTARKEPPSASEVR